MLAIPVMLARLLVALIGLALALIVIALIVVAHEGLLLLRGETRLLAEMRKALAVVVTAILGGDFRDVAVGAGLRLVLAELLLGSRDQAERMFGVLVVVFGGNGIAGRAGIARELDVFFGDVGGGAADLDVGTVGFIDPGHRVLAAPVVIIVVVIVIPVTHPLVVV